MLILPCRRGCRGSALPGTCRRKLSGSTEAAAVSPIAVKSFVDRSGIGFGLTEQPARFVDQLMSSPTSSNSSSTPRAMGPLASGTTFPDLVEEGEVEARSQERIPTAFQLESLSPVAAFFTRSTRRWRSRKHQGPSFQRALG
jgi:hypothetical protein